MTTIFRIPSRGGSAAQRCLRISLLIALLASSMAIGAYCFTPLTVRDAIVSKERERRDNLDNRQTLSPQQFIDQVDSCLKEMARRASVSNSAKIKGKSNPFFAKRASKQGKTGPLPRVLDQRDCADFERAFGKALQVVQDANCQTCCRERMALNCVKSFGEMVEALGDCKKNDPLYDLARNACNRMKLQLDKILGQ